MKPINFKESNAVIGGQVPVNRTHGMFLSRWSMTWSERISILFHGKIWMAVKGDYMPPVLLSGDQSFSIEPGVGTENGMLVAARNAGEYPDSNPDAIAKWKPNAFSEFDK